MESDAVVPQGLYTSMYTMYTQLNHPTAESQETELVFCEQEEVQIRVKLIHETNNFSVISMHSAVGRFHCIWKMEF